MNSKEIFEEIENELTKAIDAGEDPDEAADRLIPRLCYFGHTVVHTFSHPDKRAKWECCSCQHQWVSMEGARCPECKACKHTWKWVAEPYGPQDRACKECGLPFKDSFVAGKGETYEQYIKREREGRERLAKQKNSDQ